LNLAYSFWYHWISWPWKWRFGCQNQNSMLFRSWDFDKNLFMAAICKIQDAYTM